MTAPDQYCINVRKLLSMRRRPHMTHLGSEARVIAVAIKIDAARRDTLASHPSGESSFLPLSVVSMEFRIVCMAV